MQQLSLEDKTTLETLVKNAMIERLNTISKVGKNPSEDEEYKHYKQLHQKMLELLKQ